MSYEVRSLDARKRVPPEGLAAGESRMMQLDSLVAAIVARRETIPPQRALLTGITGIDASGKGFVASKIARSLGGYNVALLGADGWLNLPHLRFNQEKPGEHFYEHAFRFDEMFRDLILPLNQNRSVGLEMAFTEETATRCRRHRYRYRDIDVILLEGIFLFKQEYRHHFDLACWIECSFKTALARAVQRRQEGLPPVETVRAFKKLYFRAQRIHLFRDHPQEAADLLLPNESTSQERPARRWAG